MGTFKNVVWPCITIIVICISWVLVNGDKVVDNYRNVQSWYGSSKALEGVWDNSTEGDISPPEWLTNQSDWVETRLTIKDSTVDGTIISGKLKKLIPFDYVLLTGHKRSFRNTLDVEAFDFINGKRVHFGSFVITLEDDRIEIDSKNKNHFFPDKAFLSKKSDIAFPKLVDKKNSNEGENPPKSTSDAD